MSPGNDESLQEAILAIKERIRSSALKTGRKPEEVLVLGVTKTVEIDLMQKAFDLGITNFGENRVQEFIRKSDILNRDCFWHIIGRLQTNKVKYLDKRIALIHSLDRMELAEALQARGEKLDHIFNVLVQVNVAGEDSKAGVEPKALKDFLLGLSKMGNIHVKGLMTIAPNTSDAEDVRFVFKELKKLSVDMTRERVENISMEELSMGMSGDYTVAVEEGATIVRIGSALFGERVYS